MPIVAIRFIQMSPNQLSLPVPMTLLALVAGELDQMNWEVDSLDEIRTIFKQDPYFENSAHHQNPQAVRLVQLGYLSVLTMAGGVGAPAVRRVLVQGADIQIIWASQWVNTFMLGVWDEDVVQFVRDVNQQVLSSAYQGGGVGMLRMIQIRLRYYQGILDALIRFYDTLHEGVDRGELDSRMDPMLLGVVATHLPLEETNAILSLANRHLNESVFQPVISPDMATLQLAMVLDLASQCDDQNRGHLIEEAVIPVLKRCFETPHITQFVRESLARDMATIQGMAHFFKGVDCVLERIAA